MICPSPSISWRRWRAITSPIKTTGSNSRPAVPPSLYLRHIRVNRAKDLLVETNFSVMEIAVMVGYSSNSTFTRAFHSITGMTPKAYRECPCFKRLG